LRGVFLGVLAFIKIMISLHFCKKYLLYLNCARGTGVYQNTA